MTAVRHFLVSIYVHNHGHDDRLLTPIAAIHPKQAQLDAWYWQRRYYLELEDYGIDPRDHETAFDTEESIGMCSLLDAWARHYPEYVQGRTQGDDPDPDAFIPDVFTRPDGSIDWMAFWTSDHTLPRAFEYYITHPQRLCLMAEGQAVMVNWMAYQSVDDCNEDQRLSLGGTAEMTPDQFTEWLKLEDAAKRYTFTPLP